MVVNSSSMPSFHGIVLHDGTSSSQFFMSEKERAVHSFTDADLVSENPVPKFFLVACCLSNAINPKNFIKKMGDKLRIQNGEPWHFLNHLILLHSPIQLQNVSRNDFSKFQFLVQIHRLPFLSKSRALATKVGEWIGEYIDVYEESFHEGWGSFIRIRVWIDISLPLMKGKLVNLPKVRDEHWLEFRYENLPTFCFHCGRISHPFDKCSGFLEIVDAGVEPDLPFGPFMMGDKLPNSGYDRYRYDFSKANVYPFLTRMARKSIASTIPNTNYHQTRLTTTKPYPSPLTVAETSNSSKNMLPQKETIPVLPSPFPNFFQSLSSTMLTSPTNCHITPNTPHPNYTSHSMSSNIYATYPPSDHLPPLSGQGPQGLFCDSTITSFKDKGKAVLVEESSLDGIAPSKAFKRHVDPENFRSVLKRCRNNIGSSKEVNEFNNQQISNAQSDSNEENSFFSAEVLGQQPRMEP
uniref:Zinc knuckle CX2CX4HX4C domain-containing protein n=1 Tax=Cannabis sativa TaxID=3483 RepID=A0A803QCC9_CANSA